MYKIKIYKNGKLFAEYDLKDYLLMDENGQSFVSTGESPQQFILNSFNGTKNVQKEEDSDVMEAPPEKEQKKKPTLKEIQALKYIVGRMDKDAH